MPDLWGYQMSEADKSLPEPENWQYSEKQCGEYMKLYDPEIGYLQLYTDAPSPGTIEYFFDEVGRPNIYRRMERKQSTIMPSGDVRKYINFERDKILYPIQVRFPSRLPYLERNAWYPIEPEKESNQLMGAVGFMEYSVSIDLSKIFLARGVAGIILDKGFELDFYQQKGKTKIINSMYYSNKARYETGKSWENPPEQVEETFYLHSGDEYECYGIGQLIRLSWLLGDGFVTVKETYLPDSEDEITKIIRAPLNINHQLATKLAFRETDLTDIQNIPNAGWLNIDSIIPVQIGFSGPGFARFMGVSNE